MDRYTIKTIGIKETSREDAYLYPLEDLEELKDILSRDFDEWSNFDRWESIESQQWIFNRALSTSRGKKIDIQCDCCEYIGPSLGNSINIKNQKCNGIKSAYMIGQVVDEILFAKLRRKSDGTYSA